MNIMIDEKLHHLLNDYKLTVIPFGGRAKGKNDGDYDVLCIIPDFHLSALLPYNNKHLLQYSKYINNEKYEDYIYMTLSQLVHSVVNGDNMFIIEIVLSSLFDKQHLSKISNDPFIVEFFNNFYLSEFSTFNILRGLLGLAERDLKQIEYKKDFTLKDNKKFRFVKESLYYFFTLYNDNDYHNRYVDLNLDASKLVFNNYEDYIVFRDSYKSMIDSLRNKINPLSATYKTFSIDMSLHLMEKISKYALINNKEINKMLHKIYYNGITNQ